MSDESTPTAANEDGSETESPEQEPEAPVAEEQPAGDAPADEAPAAEAAADEQPAGDAPADEQPAAEAGPAPAEAPAPPEPPKPARPPVTSSSAGTGRRKEAVARVRLVPGSGQFDLGGRTLEQAFPNRAHRMEITAPLRLVDHDQDVDVLARLTGGGVAGQAGALRHGIARALVDLDPDLRPALKAEGFLTRDSREKERRKYGLKKARKAPQYSKR